MGSNERPFAGSLALGSRFLPALNGFIRTIHDVDDPSDTISARAPDIDIQGRLRSQQLRVTFGYLSVLCRSV